MKEIKIKPIEWHDSKPGTNAGFLSIAYTSIGKVEIYKQIGGSFGLQVTHERSLMFDSINKAKEKAQEMHEKQMLKWLQ